MYHLGTKVPAAPAVSPGRCCLLGRVAQNITIIQQIGLSVLAAASVAWVVGLVRILRRERADRARVACAAHPAGGGPQAGPPAREAVALTEAERDAFAGLIRQLDPRRS